MIILICGTSSAGKTTISKALQAKLGGGWLHFNMDRYLAMLGASYSEGLNLSNPNVCVPNDSCYAKKHEDGSYEIIAGKDCSALSETIPDTLRIIAAKPFHIIADIVVTSKEELSHYRHILGGEGFLSVYLDVSEAVAVQREQKRGDRLPGSAVHWLKKLDFKQECDVVIDSSEMNLEAVVERIYVAIEANGLNENH